MDSSHTSKTLNFHNNERHNEKKKEMAIHGDDVNAISSEMVRQVAEDVISNSSDGSSGDSEDLVNTINYNTITSLAALKDILQGDGNDTPEADSFFQHYFMNHCNNLSSRNSISPFPFPERRRLSQCREEDEDDEKKEIDLPSSKLSSESCSDVASISSASTSTKERNTNDGNGETVDDGVVETSSQNSTVIDLIGSGQESTKRTVMGVRHKFLVTPTSQPPQLSMERVLLRQPHNAHTVHFGTKGPEEIRPSVHSIFAGQNLHRDKQYFDSSLIEIRSIVDDPNTTSEDIWVKRTEEKPVRSAKIVGTNNNSETENTGSRTRRVSLGDEKVDGRSRALSWGSRRDPRKDILFKRKESAGKESEDKKKQRHEGFDVAITRSTQSVGERRRRGSADDGGAHTLYQQTIHGTSGVSRRPALFDIFKSKRSDVKKPPSFMQQVRTAVHNMGKASPREASKEAPEMTVKSRDGSAHPHQGSDAQYYHTMTASTSNTRRPSSAISKVRDIFRGKPGTSDAGDKRKKAQENLQHGNGAVRRLAASLAAGNRRSSLGHQPMHHRAADVDLDPERSALLFRDLRGLPKVDPFLEKITSEEKADEAQILVNFFKFHTCYDLLPTSAKLVIFDTQLQVKKAFFALVCNGVRAAPLWDSATHSFVGMLTITDFIKILNMYYTGPNEAMFQLEEHILDSWRRVLSNTVGPLISITPEESLFDAIKALIENRIHRLPVIDRETGDVLSILTHKRILRFLFLYINDLPKPSYLHSKLRDLPIGTMKDIETAHEDTTILEALQKFVNRRVSALPIVDAEGRLKDIYAKFDVINLAAEKTYNNLDVPLNTANEHRNAWFEGVQKCTLDETLLNIMDRIVKAEVHRLVVVDEEEKVIGIISLSDLLSYIVLRPTGESVTSLRTDDLNSLRIDERDENQNVSDDDNQSESDDNSLGRRTPYKVLCTHAVQIKPTRGESSSNLRSESIQSSSEEQTEQNQSESEDNTPDTPSKAEGVRSELPEHSANGNKDD